MSLIAEGPCRTSPAPSLLLVIVLIVATSQRAHTKCSSDSSHAAQESVAQLCASTQRVLYPDALANAHSCTSIISSPKAYVWCLPVAFHRTPCKQPARVTRNPLYEWTVLRTLTTATPHEPNTNRLVYGPLAASVRSRLHPFPMLS